MRSRRVATPIDVADFGGASRAITHELGRPTGDDRTALEWARATFEGPPAVVRFAVLAGFRVVLGLRLDPHDRARVLGWRVVPSPDLGADTIVLTATARLLDGYNVVTVTEHHVRWSTLVRYRSRVARPLWRALEPVHLVVLPLLLARARRAGC